MTETTHKTSLQERSDEYGDLKVHHPLKCLLEALKEARRPLVSVSDGNIRFDLKAVQDRIPLDNSHGTRRLFGNKLSNVMNFRDSDYISTHPENQFEYGKTRKILAEIDEYIEQQIKDVMEQAKDQLRLTPRSFAARASGNQSWRSHKKSVFPRHSGLIPP
jgi:hypothetical protein